MSERKVPKIRFPGFTGEWEQKKLDSILDERHEFTTVNYDYPRLSFTIEEGVIDPEDRKTNKRDFLIKDEENKKYLKTEYDDIIYNPANVVFGAIHRNKKGRGCLSPIYKIFTTDQDQQFIENLVRRDSFIAELSQLTEGTVIKLRTLKPEAFLNMLVMIPNDLEEQGKIGSLLCLIDEHLAKVQLIIEKWQELKKGMLQKMFPKEGESVPEIRFQGFADPWEQRKFSDFAQRESAFRSSSAEYPSIEYEDVVAEEGRLNKIVRKKETQKTGITFDGTQVLYGKLRPYLHNWLNPDFAGVAVGDWWVLRPVEMDKKFLYRLIQTQQFDEVANQSSGSKMPRADWNLVSNTDFVVPSSLEEQRQIAEAFDAIDDLITLHQRECEKWQSLKKALLQQMFV